MVLGTSKTLRFVSLSRHSTSNPVGLICGVGYSIENTEFTARGGKPGRGIKPTDMSAKSVGSSFGNPSLYGD